MKSLLENKLHKERMAVLYAFEQLIINTEDDDQQYYEEYDPEELYEDEFDPYLVYPCNRMEMMQQEYIPADVIDEEECEESQAGSPERV